MNVKQYNQQTVSLTVRFFPYRPLLFLSPSHIIPFQCPPSGTVKTCLSLTPNPNPVQRNIIQMFKTSHQLLTSTHNPSSKSSAIFLTRCCVFELWLNYQRHCCTDLISSIWKEGFIHIHIPIFEHEWALSLLLVFGIDDVPLWMFLFVWSDNF